MDLMNQDQIRQNVRKRYKEIALLDAASGDCGCCAPSSACGSAAEISARMGYSEAELSAVPEGANLGLGCGNPLAIAELKPGETVLDLGSGGGFDCFLAARQVGETGRVIGVDMTPEMVSKARANAAKGGFANTEFRLGEIEHLPVADASVDVIISNCVINLSPDKRQVFREVWRVLKPGGRLAIFDIVLTADLPPEIRNDLETYYAGCISGAIKMEDYEQILTDCGFSKIRIDPGDNSKAFIRDWVPGTGIEHYVVSASIKAVKEG